jgi:hypothetical protein
MVFSLFKSEPAVYDASIESEYELTVRDLAALMQMRSMEATEKINRDYGGVKGIAEKLKTNAVNGLSINIDDIKKRQYVFGRNEIPPKPPKYFLVLVFEALQDTTLVILLISAIVSIGLSFYHPPSEEVSETQVTTSQGRYFISSIKFNFTCFYLNFSKTKSRESRVDRRYCNISCGVCRCFCDGIQRLAQRTTIPWFARPH